MLQLCPCLFCFPLTDIPQLYGSPYTTELGFGDKQCLAVVQSAVLDCIVWNCIIWPVTVHQQVIFVQIEVVSQNYEIEVLFTGLCCFVWYFLAFALCTDVCSHGLSMGHVVDCYIYRRFSAWNCFHYVSYATCHVMSTSQKNCLMQWY